MPTPANRILIPAASFAATNSAPDRVPTATGANVMDTRHAAPSTSHIGQLFVCANSDVTVIWVKINGAPLLFETEMIFGAAEAPTTTEPNCGAVSLNTNDCEKPGRLVRSNVMSATDTRLHACILTEYDRSLHRCCGIPLS